ncbi:hypothetical protein [Leucothrix arctica]|uniref:RiboL-PSP-HEPN domain-containing protein n=1 Tax=Leucothrix arctica TaxID=1481894 RepID=A0A317CG49_9GAMM|nr:hypothetical protein [Leucothrix arctica]PWQ97564.1 hypothetical protein DKT75_06500 [Leucothrix arctica]
MMSITYKINKAIRMTTALENFWSSSRGWAPESAAELLAEARLDRQISFAHTLSDYLEPFPEGSAEARIILGYTTLRSMAEGALKLFFSVWFEDYQADVDAARRKGELVSPEDVKFDYLIFLYVSKFGNQYQDFLRQVQYRGNAIHHFKHRDIGTQQELIADIESYCDFLTAINDGLPYPDEMYNPALA